MNPALPPSHYDSYPPLFRPNSTPTHDAPTFKPKPKPDPGSDLVPVIDLQRLNHNDLASACENWGVFRLVNHGVPTTLLTQLHDRAKEIFSLPFESKNAQRMCSGMPYFWGTPALTPTGVAIERKGPTIPTNMKWFEGFYALVNQLSQVHVDDPVIDNFRLLLDEYGRHQTRLATTIFKAMAENLNLDQQQSESYFSPSTGNMRVYRYLRCPQPDQHPWGLDAHTDSSVLTILTHFEVGGFQVCTGDDDEWLNVEPIPNTLVVILGDLIQAMSDDKYISVKHRVKANKSDERISAGYFFFPPDDGVIHSSKYKPFTYPDFRAQVQQQLKTLGFKKGGLDHFRLTQASEC